MTVPAEVPSYVIELGVAGTWSVATIALFGQPFWSWIRRPRLRVELLDEDGELEVETLPEERTREARYYRLQVKNKRRATAVQDVQIVVDAIERPRPNGQPEAEYRGPIPLMWQHARAFPRFRNVGTAAVADFVVVTEERTLRLITKVTPNKYAQEYVGATQLWVTVAARGRESDSPPVRYKIAWDGAWERGAAEMRSHLTIDVV